MPTAAMLRMLAGVVGLAGAALLATACTGAGSSDSASGGTPASGSTPAPGCGLVPEVQVLGLLGDRVRTAERGTASALRHRHAVMTCRSTVPGHPERYVVIRAEYHPAPLQLPKSACSQGWVYAGTPDKFTPACQEAPGGHGRTQLFVRWQPYVMHVTIGRADRNWGGDPETALAMSRTLAQHLGVREARGSG